MNILYSLLIKSYMHAHHTCGTMAVCAWYIRTCSNAYINILCSMFCTHRSNIPPIICYIIIYSRICMYHTYFLLYLARIHCHAANCSWCTCMQEQYMRYCLAIQQLPHRYITVTNPARYYMCYDSIFVHCTHTVSQGENRFHGSVYVRSSVVLVNQNHY